MVGEGGAKIERYNNFTLPLATYNLIHCQHIIFLHSLLIYLETAELHKNCDSTNNENG